MSHPIRIPKTTAMGNTEEVNARSCCVRHEKLLLISSVACYIFGIAVLSLPIMISIASSAFVLGGFGLLALGAGLLLMRLLAINAIQSRKQALEPLMPIPAPQAQIEENPENELRQEPREPLRPVPVVEQKGLTAAAMPPLTIRIASTPAVPLVRKPYTMQFGSSSEGMITLFLHPDMTVEQLVQELADSARKSGYRTLQTSSFALLYKSKMIRKEQRLGSVLNDSQKLRLLLITQPNQQRERQKIKHAIEAAFHPLTPALLVLMKHLKFANYVELCKDIREITSYDTHIKILLPHIYMGREVVRCSFVRLKNRYASFKHLKNLFIHNCVIKFAFYIPSAKNPVRLQEDSYLLKNLPKRTLVVVPLRS